MEVIKMKLNVIRIFENGDSKDQKEDILTERESKKQAYSLAETPLLLHKEISHMFLLVTETRKMCNAWQIQLNTQLLMKNTVEYCKNSHRSRLLNSHHPLEFHSTFYKYLLSSSYARHHCRDYVIPKDLKKKKSKKACALLELIVGIRK